MFHRSCFPALATVTGSLAFALAGPVYGQHLNVLFIGNSYTSVNDLPNMLRALALSVGDTVDVAMSAPGGYTLMDHLGNTTTLDAIDSRAWDFVVMQEQSQWGALIAENAVTSLSASAQLCQAIEANNECTYPVFYMTWGRENGDALNCPNFPNVCTFEGMQQNLRSGYLRLGQYNSGRVAPVGMAWRRVRMDHPTIVLYQADGSHPTVAGSYLAACTFYATLFGQDCLSAGYNASLDGATAAVLRQVACSTVLDSASTWLLDVPNGTNATWYVIDIQADAITFSHPGEGTHQWTTSTGATSTAAQPTFTFPGPGVYTVTHIYHDPCGNVDTVSAPVEIVPMGIDGPSGTDIQVLTPAASTLEVRGAGPNATLMVFDVQGRSLLTKALEHGHSRHTVPSGAAIWVVRQADGTSQRGTVVVP